MDPFRRIECECEILDRPVNAFGDFVCQTNSNVRDIIRKFEEHENSDNFGTSSSLNASNSATPRKYSSERFIQKRLVYEDPSQNFKRAVQMTVHEFFPKRLATRSRDNILETESNSQKNKATSSSQQTPQGIFTGKNTLRKDPDNMTYPSKTTICKTDLGVRIIIEINFDTVTKLENWRDSRIETDIPHSEILAEFQKNVV